MNDAPVMIERRQPHDCKYETTIVGLVHDRDSMKNTMESVSTKLDLILAQITRVAILEEKHQSSTTDINRAHLYIANLEKQVNDLGKEVRDFMAYAKGMSKMAWVVWGILSSGLGIMLAKLLLFSSPSIPL